MIIFLIISFLCFAISIFLLWLIDKIDWRRIYNMKEIKLLPQWTQTTQDRCDILMILVKEASKISVFKPLNIYRSDYLRDDQYMYSGIANELYLSTNIYNCLTKDFTKGESIWKDFSKFRKLYPRIQKNS